MNELALRSSLTCYIVFEYKFTRPGETKAWAVRWDYENGLVMTKNFFKIFDYNKVNSPLFRSHRTQAAGPGQC